MARILVNLEIIVDTEDLLMSEVETVMHKMLSATELNVYDYGLDMEYMD